MKNHTAQPQCCNYTSLSNSKFSKYFEREWWKQNILYAFFFRINVPVITASSFE
jgi:hypothetical protein